MKFKLTRTECGEFGQFGVLSDEQGKLLFHTMEHTYPGIDQYCPKVPTGTYTCLLGTHQLTSSGPFKTYELQNVPNHSGILIHPGNTEVDSHGCILIGESRGELHGLPAVLESKKAFDAFMALTGGAESLELEISDV